MTGKGNTVVLLEIKTIKFSSVRNEDMILMMQILISYNTFTNNMSRLVGKPTMWFPNRSDTNQAVQSQKTARSMKFCI